MCTLVKYDIGSVDTGRYRLIFAASQLSQTIRTATILKDYAKKQKQKNNQPSKKKRILA